MHDRLWHFRNTHRQFLIHAKFAVFEAMLRIEDSAGSMVKGCKGSPSMHVKLAEIQGNSAEIANFDCFNGQ